MRTGLTRVVHAIEITAAIGLGIVTVVVFASAIGRYGFAKPIPDNFDLARLLLGATIMWGLAILNWRGGHIAVSIFTTLLRPKTRHVIDVFARIVLLAACAVMAWKMFGRVETTYRAGEVTFDLRLRVWPFITLIWLGAVAATVAAAARVIFTLLHPGEEPEEDEEAYLE